MDTVHLPSPLPFLLHYLGRQDDIPCYVMFGDVCSDLVIHKGRCKVSKTNINYSTDSACKTIRIRIQKFIGPALIPCTVKVYQVQRKLNFLTLSLNIEMSSLITCDGNYRLCIQYYAFIKLLDLGI